MLVDGGAWAETVQRVRFQNLRVHDLRHIFTVQLYGLDVGHEPRQVSRGHRIPGMTANYSRGDSE